MDDFGLTIEEELELSRLPREYWACPLCLITLLEAHAQGSIHHEAAFEVLRNSGLVETWEGTNLVRTTERGRAFVEFLLATPLPVQKWVDPRKESENG